MIPQSSIFVSEGLSVNILIVMQCCQQTSGPIYRRGVGKAFGRIHQNVIIVVLKFSCASVKKK